MLSIIIEDKVSIRLGMVISIIVVVMGIGYFAIGKKRQVRID